MARRYREISLKQVARIRSALRGKKYVEASYGAKGTAWEKAHIMQLKGGKVFVHFHPARLEDYAIGGEWVSPSTLKNIKVKSKRR